MIYIKEPGLRKLKYTSVVHQAPDPSIRLLGRLVL